MYDNVTATAPSYAPRWHIYGAKFTYYYSMLGMKAVENFSWADSFAWEFWVYHFSGDYEHYRYSLLSLTYRYDKTHYWKIESRPRYD
jgi:hypothetical protein